MLRERRYIPAKVAGLQLRTADDGSHVIGGHGAVFNRLSQNLGGFVEQVAPGAFTKTIGEADIRGLFNHDPNWILGRNTAGTLRLDEDNVGLAYEIDVPDTSLGRDLVVSMRRKDITQSSFSFRTIDDEWGLTPEGFPLRTLLQVQLYDVSPVTFPAYLEADSTLVREAVAHLAESRHVAVDEVVALAGRGELRSLIEAAPPEQTSTAQLQHRSRLLELEGRRHPGAA